MVKTQQVMPTHFAPAERTSPQELHLGINAVNNSPVLTTMLQAVGGLLVILDEHRQIVALNDSFCIYSGQKTQAQHLACGLVKPFTASIQEKKLGDVVPQNTVQPVELLSPSLQHLSRVYQLNRPVQLPQKLMETVPTCSFQ